MKSILAISDLHFPFHHKDTFKFLRDLKRIYKPNVVIQLGDFVDQHAMGRWTPEADAVSSVDEWEVATNNMSELVKIFPNIQFLLGNHDLRFIKRAKDVRIPSMFVRNLREVYDVPATVGFHDSMLVNNILFTHGEPFCGKTATDKLLVSHRCSVVHGHVHGHAGVVYSANAHGTIWGMNAGAMIDEKAYAFSYGKAYPNKAVVGSGIIINGVPQFIPM